MLNRYAFILIAVVVLFAMGMANAENLQERFQYLHPVPGSELVSKQTTIIMRTGDYVTTGDIGSYSRATITGSESGSHNFEVIISSDDKTAILKTYAEFSPGEVVTVKFPDGRSFSFEISSKRQPLFTLEDWQRIYYGDEFESFDQKPSTPRGDLTTDRDPSLPSDFPIIEVYVNNNPSPGYIFMQNVPMPYPVYQMILDNDGTPVFYMKMPQWSFDFKKQPLGLLTYNSFPQPMPGNINATYYAMNNTYTVIDSFKCGNGYNAFAADMQLSLDYHALLMSYDPQTVDMSLIVPGGDTAATVTGLIIQELDSLKNVVFQWRSWDHFEITDATYDVDLTASYIDYVHGNSVEWDDDGHILVSCRHMDEVTKINRSTGDIIWRLGGENNDFTLVGDTVWFSHQHDARRIDNGNITVYDNGNLHTPQFSRAVEYALDTTAMTCTHIWEFRDSPDIYGSANGNAQRLPNGNTLICWGKTWPNVVEVQPDGTKEHEISFPGPTPLKRTFKAYRFPWTGIASVPYLLVEATETGAHLIFNKFGDAAVDRFKIYMGDSPNPTTAIDSTTNNYYDVTGLVPGYTHYFTVTAIDYIGFETDPSNEESITWFAPYLPGDANGDDQIIGSDVTFLVNYFRGLSTPPDSCWNANTEDWLYTAADANGDCLNIGSDVTLLVNYFRGTGEVGWCEDTPPYGY